jgi:hypothetical protein
MKGLDVGYGVLCHRFGLRQGGAALTVQLAWKAFLGSRVVPSASGLLSVSGQNHLSPKNPATKIITTTTPSPDEDERQFRVWQFSFARYQLLTVNSLEHIGELPRPLLR